MEILLFVTQEDVFGQGPTWENKPGARSDLSTCITSTSMGGHLGLSCLPFQGARETQKPPMLLHHAAAAM